MDDTRKSLGSPSPLQRRRNAGKAASSCAALMLSAGLAGAMLTSIPAAAAAQGPPAQAAEPGCPKPVLVKTITPNVMGDGWSNLYLVEYEGGSRLIHRAIKEKTRPRNRLWRAQCDSGTKYWLQYVHQVQRYHCPVGFMLGFPMEGDCVPDGDRFYRAQADNPIHDKDPETRMAYYCESDAAGNPNCLRGRGSDREFIPPPV